MIYDTCDIALPLYIAFNFAFYLNEFGEIDEFATVSKEFCILINS